MGVLERITNISRQDFIEIFGMIIYLTSMAYAWAVTFHDIPEQNQDNSKLILGFLMGSALTIVLQYFFQRESAPKEKGKDE